MIFLLPASIPSLPIFTVDVAPSACLFSTVNASPSIVNVVLVTFASGCAGSTGAAFVIDVIFFKSFTKPISSLPSTFLVRMLLAAVATVSATVPSPTMSSCSPNFLAITSPRLPLNFKPFSTIAFAVLCKSVTFTAELLTVLPSLASFNLAK